jgi:hypothetical protein
MNARVRRGIATILLAIHLAGCSSWQSVGGVGGAERVRVTRRTGEQIELTRPTIRGDSIVAGSIAIPRSDVESVEVRRISAGRTLLLVAGIVVLFPAILVVGYAGCDTCGDFTGSAY